MSCFVVATYSSIALLNNMEKHIYLLHNHSNDFTPLGNLKAIEYLRRCIKYHRLLEKKKLPRTLRFVNNLQQFILIHTANLNEAP